MPPSTLASQSLPNHKADWNILWQQYAVTAEQNPAQTFRRTLVAHALQLSDTQPMRIVDFGSGQGDLALLLRHLYPLAEIQGLDLSQTGVNISKAKVPSASFAVADMLKPDTLPSHLKGWPTHAVCAEVLEHVDDDLGFLRTVRSIMPKGSWFIVTVPGGPRTYFDHHIGHLRHYTRESLAKVLTEAGFTIRHLEAPGWPFFNIYKLLIALRGKAFLADIDAKADAGRSTMRALVAKVFDVLLRQQKGTGRLGWQMLAVVQPAEKGTHKP